MVNKNNNDASGKEKSNLDLLKLEQILLSTEKKVKNTQANKVVLVIGRTGSGKSTLINYMQGNHMVQREDNHTGNAWVDVTDESNSNYQVNTFSSPIIGSSASSETKYPDVYKCNKDYLLCDTAGFADNRGREEDLCTYLSVQLAVLYASEIKGVVVVIELPSLEASKGNEVDRLLNVINNLISNHEHLAKSFLFAFTKAYKPDGGMLTDQQIRNRLKAKAEAMAKINNKALSHMYNYLANHPKIIVPNFLDNGALLPSIFDQIEGFKSIPKDQFQLSIDENDYAGFREIVVKIAQSFLDKQAIQERNSTELTGIERHISALKERIEELQKENDRFKKDGLDMSTYLDAQSKLLKEKEQVLSQKANTVEATHGTVVSASDKAHRAGHAASTCQPYKVYITEERGHGGPFGFVVDFVAGKKEVTREEVRYPSNYNEIHTHFANAKKSLHDSERLLKGLEEDRANASSLVAEIRNRLNDFALTRAKREVEAKEVIQRNEAEIGRHQTAIADFSARHDDLKNEYHNIEEELAKEEEQYQMLLRINHYFGFSEPEIYEFMTKYGAHSESLSKDTQGIEAKTNKAKLGINKVLFFTPKDPIATPKVPGLIYQPVPGDGHCLFHAVGLYLGQAANTLRTQVSNSLDTDLSALGDFIDLAPGRTLESYLADLRSGVEWATHVEIEVLMRVLNRPIIVIDPNNQIRNRGDAQRFSGEPIFVYYNDTNHYDALILKERMDGRELLNSMLNPNNNNNLMRHGH